MMKNKIKLGLNIDHVATVRQARGGVEPDLLAAARQGILGGALGITVHLREDRRHIQDHDIFQLKKSISVPLNLEMSINSKIVDIVCRLKPEKACLVPERRKELTTEGGLDAAGKMRQAAKVIQKLKKNGIVVSVFIDPIEEQIHAAAKGGADYIELHTGTYANSVGKNRSKELNRLKEGSLLGHKLGLSINAGHGLNYENVVPVAQLPYMDELNIGHSIIARSIFVGMKTAVSEMCELIRKR